MREALNSNPVAQIAVLGVLLVVVGFLMMTRVMKQDDGGSTSPAPPAAGAEAAAAGATAGTTTPTSIGGGPPPATVPDAGSSASTAASGAVVPSGSVTPDALVPGRGLPRELVSAWRSGDAVVLLIVRGGGIDDRLVRGSVESLSRDAGVSVFVTRAGDVARYSRVTQGVGVSRAPALVLIRPRRLSGAVPQAQVEYGFRDSQSVVQAVHDALYTGRDNAPYHPE
jgi:hypothetical protein